MCSSRSFIHNINLTYSVNFCARPSYASSSLASWKRQVLRRSCCLSLQSTGVLFVLCYRKGLALSTVAHVAIVVEALP